MSNLDKKKDKILIIGNGSWATALYKILATNQLKPYWWVRQPETRDFILTFKHNPRYLSQVEIDIRSSHIDIDLKKILKRKEIIVFATPSKYLENTVSGLTAKDLKDKLVVSAIKGVIESRKQSPLEFLTDKFKLNQEKLASISGPCHAEEVAAEKLSYLTFSSQSQHTADKIAALFQNRFIRVSTSSDVYGTEYAAILKNIYAILAGICHGLGYGDNFQAVLVSTALREMQYFLSNLYPGKRDLAETCYSGDLLVTSYSQFSRNRTLGNMVGKGYSVKSAILEMNMVAEGFDASKSIYAVCRNHNLQTPLIDAVYRILHQNIAPSIEISLLTNFLNQKIY